MITMTAKSDLSGVLKSFKAVEAAVSAQLDKEGKRFSREYGKTYATWKVPPKFNTTKEVTDTEASVTVSTENDIYRFLHDGTRVRYAALSPDWQSKTQPRVLRSNAGAGKVLRRGHTAGAHQGIEAREWTQVIVEEDGGKFQKNMDDAIRKALS